ncbi:MAG: hypothetical protein C0592_01595 [Marinilabiliales bacterium]|nr:MAG: hypothetical protein C0592_01595 [Marinilabiliales bacterium]
MKFIFIFLFVSSFYQLKAQTPQIDWWYDIHDESFGISAMADLDFDGYPEVVFSAYRNDSCLYVLNADDGSLLWKVNTGGCNDVAPLIYDVDHDDTLDIVLASSCVPKTFCFNGMTGKEKWQCNTRGSDSPPTIADIDDDGVDEVLHGEFMGYVICINAVTGVEEWEMDVDGGNSWVQTAPTILDLNGDQYLDFVVATWGFGDTSFIRAYRGPDQHVLWTSYLPQDVMYHGAAYADIDKDGMPELSIGSYDGTLYVLNGENGSLKWQYTFPGSTYIGAPTSIADLNNDDSLEIIAFAGYQVACFSPSGIKLWDKNVPAYASSFRGAAIADVNEDDTLDIVFGASDGVVYAWSGASGANIWEVDLRAHHDSSDFEIDHAPVIGDFDNDNNLDVFIVGGKTYYPDIEYDYGRAYVIDLGMGLSADWPMFRHDVYRSACLCENSFAGIENADAVEFSVFPNPVSEYLFISNPDKVMINSVEIYNLNGTLVYYSDIRSLNDNRRITVSDLANGVYFIRINTEKGLFGQKFLVL